MKIQELINLLEGVLSTHGNLRVVCNDSEEMWDVISVRPLTEEKEVCLDITLYEW